MDLDKFLRQINTDTDNELVELIYNLGDYVLLYNHLDNYDRLADLIKSNKDKLKDICNNESQYDLLNDDTRFIMIMISISTLRDVNNRIEAMLQSLIIRQQRLGKRNLKNTKATERYVRNNEDHSAFSKIPKLKDRNKLKNSDNRNELVHSAVIPTLQNDYEILETKDPKNAGFIKHQFTNANNKNIEQVKAFLNDVEKDIEEINRIQNLLVELLLKYYNGMKKFIDENTLSKIEKT